ncbi:beta-hexosaminidase [Thioclava sp. SK-1]|uniref:beta-N-acetylhexosaminidase n=1 Tax=Thioclava sp. SK-1 TaxID=1889770 RepID=UPI000825B153|nr:beta-N-acetylhexosaminidase [Thioclava sp. SK-1]OCX60968.1 beta-hexosaminidase [Thioclava sp. SK-1]
MTTAVILGLEGPDLSAREQAFFRDSDPWGFILFARNVDTPERLRRLTQDLRTCVGRDAPILIDQEGGRVQRLRAPHWREWLPPLEQAQIAQDPARSFWLRALIMAAELRAAGIDANCAPCCDIAGPQTHPFLRNRCFGGTPEDVMRLARMTADGFLAGGVLPIIKHIPGHGRATADSHKDLPTVTASIEDLAQDFAPFAALNDLPMAMTAHIRFTAFDTSPATQSRKMMDVIRQEIGFDGLVMTDDLSMQALSGTILDRAQASIAAGCDVVLHCNGDALEAAQAVQGAGILTRQASRRADAALARRITPQPIDLDVLDADLARLLTP